MSTMLGCRCAGVHAYLTDMPAKQKEVAHGMSRASPTVHAVMCAHDNPYPTAVTWQSAAEAEYQTASA